MACSENVCVLRCVRGRASARGNRGRVFCVVYCVVGTPCVAPGSLLLRLVAACLLFFNPGCMLFLDSGGLAALGMWENVLRCFWFGDGCVFGWVQKCCLLVRWL